MLELSHKKLHAWQKAIELMPLLYALCAKLPKEEIYILAAQMKRAGLSVSNNVAEVQPEKVKQKKIDFSK